MILHRRIGSPPALTWPDLPADSGARLAVVDLPAAASTAPAASGDTSTAVVLVARTTVPGATALEVLVARSDHPLLIAVMIGPRRWPHPVNACLGPHLRALRDAGQLTTMPWDRHLAVTGITSRALPAALMAAAGTVLDLLPGGSNAAAPPRPADALEVEDGHGGLGVQAEPSGRPRESAGAGR